RAVRSPAVPLRADLLELGDGHGLLLGEPGELERRLRECSLGTERGARTPSDGSALGSRTPDAPSRSVHAAVSRSARPLRGRAGTGGRGLSERERRCGAEPSPVQACGGTGATPARKSRPPQPRGLRVLPARDLRATQRGTSGAISGRAGGGAATPRLSALISSPDRRSSRGGKHDTRSGEHLLGAQPPDRGKGHGALGRRRPGDLVRTALHGPPPPSA